MRILVTGGAGFIGSHAVLALLQAGHEVVVVDNLVNSKEEALRRVADIAGRAATFFQVDLRDRVGLTAVFRQQPIDAVMHFAGLKAVGESVAVPLAYYDNNIGGTVALCQVMAEQGVKQLVFSSSATVYGEPERVPVTEETPLREATNPYGRTKAIIEKILQDLAVSDRSWHIALLRYFNPVGAHSSGRIGEDPHGLPNNLLPYITQVAVGKLPFLRVFGNDYNTPDGTGVRDYIHVVDLVEGHLKALAKLAEQPGVVVYNLGTGVGYSVLDVVRTMAQVSGREIPYQMMARRPGDVAVSYADPSRAARELGWHASRDLEAMCADAWRWQSQNPDGYV